MAAELWDSDTHGTVVDWLMKTGRASGSPLVLRLGLAQLASRAALSGDLARAMAAIAEEEAIADATGGPPVSYPRLHLAAMRGRRREATELFEKVAATASPDGAGQLADLHHATAVLNNGLTDYRAALAAARLAAAYDGLGRPGMVLPELVEAAVRCGNTAEAALALESLTWRAQAAGTPWAWAWPRTRAGWSPASRSTTARPWNTSGTPRCSRTTHAPISCTGSG